ncbi:UNC93-like protein 2 [Glycine max]|nr:UNC93-like protein 2 [Glycine max]
MTSYPPTNGKASSTWVESLVHGLIPFILNYHRSEAASVNIGTYIGFMCFILLGTLLSLAILPACKVLRDDGSRCTNMLYSNVSTECVEVLKLFSNWKVLLMRRRVWGMVGVVVVGVLGTVIWGGGLANQLSFGLLDAMFQSLVYWVIGALADDSKQHLVNEKKYNGFFKGIQSAGAAVAWLVDEHKVSFMSQLIVNWVLTTISYHYCLFWS